MKVFKVRQSDDVVYNVDFKYPCVLRDEFAIGIHVKSETFVNYLELFFATYEKTCYGKMRVKVALGDDDCDYDIDMSVIKDNKPIKFDINKWHRKKEVLSIYIKIVYKEGSHSVALWMNGTGVCAVVNAGGNREVKLGEDRPLISIITPVYNVDSKLLYETANSVIDQIYDRWEWVVIDDGSKSSVGFVVEHLQRLDDRIQVRFREENGGISKALNDGLNIAKGKYVCFLDHDDILHSEALLDVACAISKDRNIKFIYTDEDKIDAFGRHREVFFKPDWSYHLLLSQPYTCHLSVLRRSLVKKVGGFRSEYDGSQDYDLTLRCIERINESEILHIPRILYSWRVHKDSTSSNTNQKPYAHYAHLSALEDHLDRTLVEYQSVLPGRYLGTSRIKYPFVKNKSVNVIIPTRDNLTYLRTCLRSLSNTVLPDFFITVVDNDSSTETKEYLGRKLDDGEIDYLLEYDGEFNFSAINNFAVRTTRKTDYVIFLNNDTEAMDDNWIDEMLSLCNKDSVGAVGAKLLYPDNRIQHAGVIIGIGGVAGHSHKYIPDGSPGYFSRPHLVQEVSAVTAACMMVKRKVFDEVGGFEEDLPKAFNDVDLCLKIRHAGYKILYTPYACLYHYESVSRGLDNYKEKDFQKAIHYMYKKWDTKRFNDPYYNPNLSIEREDFSYRY